MNGLSNVDISPTIGFSGGENNSLNQHFSNNPFVIVVMTLIILVYMVGVGSLGPGFSKDSKLANMTTETEGLKFIEIFMWGIFVFLLLMNGLQYFFSVDITASVKNLLTPNPKIDLTVVQDEPDTVPEIKAKKQTFHIPGNEYTYDDAKAVCAAYGAKLASIKNMQDSHHSGGEWCSYGWLIIKWHYSQHKMQLIKNYKPFLVTKMIVDDLVLMVDTLKTLMFDLE